MGAGGCASFLGLLPKVPPSRVASDGVCVPPQLWGAGRPRSGWHLGHAPPDGSGEEPFLALPTSGGSGQSLVCSCFGLRVARASSSEHPSLDVAPTLILVDLLLPNSHLQRPYFQIRSRLRFWVDMYFGGDTTNFAVVARYDFCSVQRTPGA